MQLIAPEGPTTRTASNVPMLRAFLVAAILLTGSTFLGYLVFGTGLLGAFTPTGRASTSQMIVGVLAWTFALTAPAAFGIVGLFRFGTVVEQLVARRPRSSPALRARQGISDDHAVAVRVRLPDGSRVVPEIVVGPFGAAVIEELPPPRAVLARGPRSWDVRTADGRVVMIDHPLDRATRDAERVRAWFSGDDSDYIVKVYAAVVGSDSLVERTPTCAYIGPDQVRAWLASLPPQRSFDTDRRDRVVRLLRSTL
jgi:hypothetical protein